MTQTLDSLREEYRAREKELDSLAREVEKAYAQTMEDCFEMIHKLEGECKQLRVELDETRVKLDTAEMRLNMAQAKLAEVRATHRAQMEAAAEKLVDSQAETKRAKKYLDDYMRNAEEAADK